LLLFALSFQNFGVHYIKSALNLVIYGILFTEEINTSIIQLHTHREYG